MKTILMFGNVVRQSTLNKYSFMRGLRKNHLIQQTSSLSSSPISRSCISTRITSSFFLLSGTVTGAILYASPESTVFAWGSSQFGQCGLGDESNRSLPEVVQSLDNISICHISAGGNNSLVLTTNGDIYTWGRGQFKTLGHGDDSSISVPQLVDSEVKFKACDASDTHVAAVDVDGNVWTWGSKALGHNGDGFWPEMVDPKEFDGKSIISTAAGKAHTLAVTEDGLLYAWGKGYEGALGLSNSADVDKPKLVAALKNKKVVQVSAGNGFSVILTEDGKVYTCGIGDYGQTGHGTSAERYVRLPKLIRTLSRKKIKYITAGEFHAACVTEEGMVYTWGLGSNGQMGNGSCEVLNTIPTLVPNLTDIIKVSAGGGHTAAVEQSGQLYMWGAGRDGQIGRADHLESVAAKRTTPVKVDFFEKIGKSIQDVRLGNNFSMAFVQA